MHQIVVAILLIVIIYVLSTRGYHVIPRRAHFIQSTPIPSGKYNVQPQIIIDDDAQPFHYEYKNNFIDINAPIGVGEKDAAPVSYPLLYG